MTSAPIFVIAGGGLAAAKAVEALRDNDFAGQIILCADEEHLPYERPPLSKEYLAGKKSLADCTVHDSDWYRDRNVDLRLHTRVESLDTAGHTVGLADESEVHYDKLLLATGSASRRPPIPGSDAAGVHYLRSYHDAVAL
ncbi:FAD-dependent oxidoreductase, partial [Mycobacterium asiaticum]|uniref:FAD-dependent oxidoreductase n=1 Tax=Mycobacterium asiaticum TaxID=1790 RepID=UPI000B1BDC3C